MSDRVTEATFKDADARYYIVVGKQGNHTALVKRHGDLDHLLTCMMCKNTRDFSFACQHIEAVAESRYMKYED